ncbi:MAG: selenocysteine-specific translation elongation factor [Pseudomonadales bacterium]
MIITLAGHVDHGKTSLVKALTGVDTDRLAEEQRRGLTIDLGFAYQQRDDAVLGFVDVPGHQRFIHNMVAGVASMQFALLVVAADDGPMPQSREHLQILELTGVRQGVVALTKIDRVDADRVDEVMQQIRAMVHGSFLESARIFPTSAETGLGIDALVDELWSASGGHATPAPTRQFRLAIDRAFNVQGSGVVVTGTVHTGQLAKDQELMVFPGNQKVRVRGLHVQNQPADHALPGDRTAVNIAGLGLEDVGRGCWLTESECAPVRNFVVDLSVLEDFPRNVRHWSPIHVYHATTHSTGRLAFLTSGPLKPGGRIEVELVTGEPLCAKHGDHVVLRDQSLDVTLGGGRILTDLAPRRLRRRAAARLAPIAAFRENQPSDILQRLLEIGPTDLPRLQHTLGLSDDESASMLDDVACKRFGAIAIGQSTWSTWRSDVLDTIEGYLASHPDEPGIKLNQLPSNVPEAHRADLLGELAGEKLIVQTAGAYHLPTHRASLSEQEQSLLDRLQPMLDVLQAPSLGDLSKSLNTPIPKLDAGLKALANRGVLTRISDKRYYLPEHLKTLSEHATRLATQAPFTVREFRDATGIGRNVAVEVLEFFDRKGFTRRTGDTRSLLAVDALGFDGDSTP